MAKNKTRFLNHLHHQQWEMQNIDIMVSSRKIQKKTPKQEPGVESTLKLFISRKRFVEPFPRHDDDNNNNDKSSILLPSRTRPRSPLIVRQVEVLAPLRPIDLLKSIRTSLPRGAGGDAGASACVAVAGRLFRVEVVDEEFAVLAVALGGLAGDSDDVPDRGRFVEDFVHFLEGSVGGFGLFGVRIAVHLGLCEGGDCAYVEEVDTWDYECVYHGEDDVGLVADCVKGDGGDHDDHEVEDPVCTAKFALVLLLRASRESDKLTWSQGRWLEHESSGAQSRQGTTMSCPTIQWRKRC